MTQALTAEERRRIANSHDLTSPDYYKANGEAEKIPEDQEILDQILARSASRPGAD